MQQKQQNKIQKKFSNIIGYMQDYELSKHLWLMIFFAFLFSVVARFYFVYWASNEPSYFWNDQLMINTNDGYAFAEGARDYLAGFHQPNDLSYINFPLAKLTAWLKMALPFSFETIIFYMPVFLSSLIVIPILLIASEFKCLKAGFIGALLSSVAHSYYNRTMAGYYDTDILNIALAMFVLWSLVRVSVKGDKISLIATPFFLIFYLWWYYSSFTLNSAFLGIFVVYTLCFQIKRIQNYQAIILMLISISKIMLSIKITIILALLYIFIKKDKFEKFINLKNTIILLFISFILFMVLGGLNPIWFQLKFYLLRDLADNTDTKDVMLHFYNVNQTIMESKKIDLVYLMQRISSHPVVFVLSCFGYILLCFRHKEFILSLPMVTLGLLANKAGLRFTIYAVPIMSFAFGYLVYYIVKISNFEKYIQRFLLLLVTILALIPSFKHIKEYQSSTVFYASEVEVLDQLKNKTKPEDYVISWWDYGYPIRYYSDVKTLVDGGKHLGNHNFPVSFSLYKDQISAVNMARLAVEYTEKSFKDKNKTEIIEQMIKDYKFENSNDFIMSLRYNDFQLPKKTRDIFLFLPDRMVFLSQIISRFSFLDLNTGKSSNDFILFASEVFYRNNYGVFLINNIGAKTEIRKDALYIKINDKELPINTYFVTEIDHKANGKIIVQENKFDSSADFSVIYMKDYNRFVILNNVALKSTFVQLFILERYNKEILEPVILSPAAKVYKLKK